MEDENERKLRLRRRVIEEIVSSEASYLEQLNMLINEFAKPVKEKNLLPKHKFIPIFGDISQLYLLNSTLYEELRKEENVGLAFLKIAPYLKLYSAYAHDYELAIKSLQRLRNENKDFGSFISQQENLPSISRKLDSLLIAPIQRVPRYLLLISELISHTDAVNQEEISLLTSAFKQIESVATHINEQIRDQENMQRIIRIQKSLVHGKPKIVMPGRRILKEGILKKVSSDRDSAHPRYFFLFNDMLLYCKLRSSDVNLKGSLLCTCIFPLRHCKAEAVMGDGLFKVTCKDEYLLLCSCKAEEGKEWVEAINQAVRQLEANLRTLKKESSSRKPLHKRQFQPQESLSQVYQERQMTQKRAPLGTNVEILRPDNYHNNQIECKNKPESLINQLSWCPRTPTSFPCSPRKLLAFKSSPNHRKPEKIPLFSSPQIQN